MVWNDPYALLVAASLVQFANSFYARHIRRRDEKAEAERVEIARQELWWKRKTDRQLEELRGIMRRLEVPIREKLDVDIKLDR